MGQKILLLCLQYIKEVAVGMWVLFTTPQSMQTIKTTSKCDEPPCLWAPAHLCLLCQHAELERPSEGWISIEKPQWCQSLLNNIWGFAKAHFLTSRASTEGSKSFCFIHKQSLQMEVKISPHNPEGPTPSALTGWTILGQPPVHTWIFNLCQLFADFYIVSLESTVKKGLWHLQTKA